jgi:hypothetical protein
MSKRKKGNAREPAPPTVTAPPSTKIVSLAVIAGGALLGLGIAALVARKNSPPAASIASPTQAAHAALTSNTGVAVAPQPVAAPAVKTNELPVMEINKAVMVTVELDFGPNIPSIAEALLEVERRHRPDDGAGRVFAILEAYGEPTPDGKKLHMSMRVSTEKPGVGALVFKRTGAMLWQSRIILGTNTNVFTRKNLLILLDNGAGKTFTVDGSRGPASILEASVSELNMPVADFWPDGADREVTFIYSACGCPVKVMARRVGDRTMRTKDLPVMFPDDPPAVALISQLMRW